MLEINILLNLSIKDCMLITSTTWNFEGCSIAKFDNNWAYSWAWGSLTIGIGRSFTSFSSIGSSFKSKPHMDFSTPCQIYQLNHVVLCINIFLPCPLHIFFNRPFFPSKIQRGDETFQFICCFFHSRFLTFTIHGKMSTPICK